MGLFSKLFKSKPKELDITTPDFKPVTGGDAASIETAAIVNCASMGIANSLINQFISERHGTEGEEWKRGMEHFIDTPEIPSGNIRCIHVDLGEDSCAYYFNVSRPMKGRLKVFEMINKK
ncbi:hypothetical protein ACV07N_06165 [Roseivirga echinicomitans]